MNQTEREIELRKLEIEQEFQAAIFDKEQALEKERLDRQHSFEARKEYARQVLEYSLQFERHLKEYGQFALRTIFLLNGGAILALLAFIGSIVGKSLGSTQVTPALFVKPFLLYGAGLVTCTISITCAYINYMGHHQSRADPGALANNMIKQQTNWPGNFTSFNNRLVSWSWRLAFSFGLVALLLFTVGCIEVARVFQALAGANNASISGPG